ncbi:hypothetical protein Y032_0563g3513 [Ancylostoma ceylanicum]|uniref:Uncharacterized protein n=1 Tax=Ancylostoma ceylanicum TaxID=53326 RepID=A0A016WPT7_9BILA|nr:hypothetical protein Y032_0563g3513 [Ancylostoma ceylanicum]
MCYGSTFPPSTGDPNFSAMNAGLERVTFTRGEDSHDYWDSDWKPSRFWGTGGSLSFAATTPVSPQAACAQAYERLATYASEKEQITGGGYRQRDGPRKRRLSAAKETAAVEESSAMDEATVEEQRRPNEEESLAHKIELDTTEDPMPGNIFGCARASGGDGGVTGSGRSGMWRGGESREREKEREREREREREGERRSRQHLKTLIELVRQTSDLPFPCHAHLVSRLLVWWRTSEWIQ